MRKKPLRVVQYGMGQIGRECVRSALNRSPFPLRLTGVIDRNPDLSGMDVGRILNLGRETGVIVSSDAGSVLTDANPDVIIHSTQSSMEAVLPQIRRCLQAGADVVSSTEELFYPFRSHSDAADQLDRLAQEHQVSILGTGVNPGFVMDVLPVMMTAVSNQVDRIQVERVVDAASRRPALQTKVGAGLSEQEFRARAEEGQFGHVGLLESMWFVADHLGLEIDGVEETLEPVIAERRVGSDTVTVDEGEVAGIDQTIVGLQQEKEVARFVLRMFVGAEDPGDRIQLEGDPPIKVSTNGIHGDRATVAILLNSIPRVRKARPGLRTMADISLPHYAAFSVDQTIQPGM